MALLFMDGFENVAVDADLLRKWTALDDAYTATAARNGRGVRIADSAIALSNYLKKDVAATNNLIFGFAFSCAGVLYSSDLPIFTLKSGTTICLSFKFNSTDNALKIYKGSSTTLLGTISDFFVQNTWIFLEAKVVIHPTAGSVVVRKNETTVLTLSGVDTDGAGTSLCDSLTLSQISAKEYTYLDDFWLGDTSGAAPHNDFLGDNVITSFTPGSDGSHTDFTPSTGTAHYALVDETALSGTDYNESETVGHKELYQITSDVAGVITAIQVNNVMINPTGGVRKIKQLTQSDDAAETLSTDEYTVQSTYRTQCTPIPLDPKDASTWTNAKINASEFGLQVTV